jgi:Tfp pilus assembly protein PilV
MNKNSRLGGQSLIEVMLTLLIIAVGTIALIRFQNYLSYTTSVAQQRTDATLLAISTIESKRDFHVLNTMTGYTSYQSITSGSSTTSGPSATYTITWAVTVYTNPTYKTITVTVSWLDRRGITQTIQQITNIAGIDPQNSAAIT